MSSPFDIQPITIETARVLRVAVLRAGMPGDPAIFAGDDEPETAHFGAYRDGELVGVVTAMHHSRPGAGAEEWQLRGMATLPTVRGEGHGAALIAAAEAFIAEQGGTAIWFNARRAAEGFYAHQGYTTVSEEFDVPGIGPHVVMEKTGFEARGSGREG